MKKTLFYRGIILLSCVVLFACSSDDSNPEEAASVQFRATADGAAFRTDNPNATLSNNGKLLTISAIDENNNGTITIIIGSNSDDSPVITSQSYTTNNDAIPASIVFSSGGVNYATNVDNLGTINLNDLNTEFNVIFGSFNAQLVNITDSSETISITNGSFTSLEFSIQ